MRGPLVGHLKSQILGFRRRHLPPIPSLDGSVRGGPSHRHIDQQGQTANEKHIGPGFFGLGVILGRGDKDRGAVSPRRRSRWHVHLQAQELVLVGIDLELPVGSGNPFGRRHRLILRVVENRRAFVVQTESPGGHFHLLHHALPGAQFHCRPGGFSGLYL